MTKLKVVASFAVVVMMLLLYGTYQSLQGPLESSLAVKQIEDTVVQYGAVNAIIAHGIIPKTIALGGVVCLLGIWWKDLRKEFRKCVDACWQQP